MHPAGRAGRRGGLHRDRRPAGRRYREHTIAVILVAPGTFLENVRFSYVSRRAGGTWNSESSRTATTRRRRFGWLGQPSHLAATGCAMRGVGRPRPANTRKGGTRGGIVTVRNAERLRDDDAPGTSEPRMPHVILVGPGACLRARPPRRPTRLTLQPRSQHCP